MKTKVLLLSLLLIPSLRTMAVEIDPALAAAITAQTVLLKDVYDNRNKMQKSIVTAETASTLAVATLHKLENQMLEYLSNAQGAVQNLYQIKRAGELVIEIGDNINTLSKLVPKHLKGTAIAALVSDEIKDATMEMTSLYPFMKQLVTSGTYNEKDINENGDLVDKRHKVNLLNSAERYYVANEVVSRLERINTSLFILSYQIRTLSFNNLWFGLDPEGWMKIMSAKIIVNQVINDWKAI